MPELEAKGRKYASAPPWHWLSNIQSENKNNCAKMKKIEIVIKI